MPMYRPFQIISLLEIPMFRGNSKRRETLVIKNMSEIHAKECQSMEFKRGWKDAQSSYTDKRRQHQTDYAIH